VRHRKNGLPTTHPLRGPELRALREVLRNYLEIAYVFISERRARRSAATFRKLLARADDAAKLGMPIHPHMLWHSTGFKLANDGQDIRAIQHCLGHKNTQHTVLYTELARLLKGLTNRRLCRHITPTHRDYGFKISTVWAYIPHIGGCLGANARRKAMPATRIDDAETITDPDPPLTPSVHCIRYALGNTTGGIPLPAPQAIISGGNGTP
jgi:Phage integrase family